MTSNATPKWRSSCLALLVLSACGILAIPPGTSQSPDAPDLSPEFKTVYAHHHDSDTAELTAWMNTLAKDPTANDIALGPSGQLAGNRKYTITMNPKTTGKVELVPTGKIEINAYIGAGSGNGVVRVSTEVTYGGKSLATGDVQNHPFQQAGTAPYGKLTWSVTPKFATLDPALDMVWTITMDGVASSVFLGVNETRGKSNIVLPVASADVPAPAPQTPPVTFTNLTGPAAEIDLEFAESSTAQFQYNWTTDLSSVEIIYKVEFTNGSLSVRVVDETNATIFEKEAGQSENETTVVDHAGPGNWTIRVEVFEFAGSMKLSIQAPPQTIGSGPPASPSPSGEPKPTREDTPAPTLAIILVACLAPLARFRRK